MNATTVLIVALICHLVGSVLAILAGLHFKRRNCTRTSRCADHRYILLARISAAVLMWISWTTILGVATASGDKMFNNSDKTFFVCIVCSLLIAAVVEPVTELAVR